MKICLINNLYRPFSRGGAERVVEFIAEGLTAAGHNVFIITTRPYLKKRDLQPKVYYLYSLFFDLNRLPIGLRFFWHFFNMFDVGTSLRIGRILKKEKPDLVISHNLVGLSFLIPRFLTYLKIKHIHILHDIQLLHPSGLIFFGREKILNNWPVKIYFSLNKFLFKTVSVVVSPSRWLLAEHQKRGFFKKAKMKVLLNPVSQKNFEFQSKNFKKKFSFIFVGHLNKAKGIDLLLKAYQILTKKKGFRVKLFIAGSGEERIAVEKLAANDKNLIYLGYLDQGNLKKIFHQADCLVAPSLCYENSPTVVYEAVAAGLPFIVSDLGGAAELAKKFGGFSFSPANEENLVQAMVETIKNSEHLKKAAVKNKEKIRKYSVDFYIKQCLELLE